MILATDNLYSRSSSTGIFFKDNYDHIPESVFQIVVEFDLLITINLLYVSMYLQHPLYRMKSLKSD